MCMRPGVRNIFASAPILMELEVTGVARKERSVVQGVAMVASEGKSLCRLQCEHY